jgi:hypothetical protein
VERPAGTLEPYGLQTQGSYPDSISRRCVVEVAAAFGLPLPSLAAVAGGAFLGAFDISFDLGH